MGRATTVPMAVSRPRSTPVWVMSWEAAMGRVWPPGPAKA